MRDIGVQNRDQRRLAVARVSMWMQRGNCPHMVESTALLMAAILSDEEQTGIGGAGGGAGGAGAGTSGATRPTGTSGMGMGMGTGVGNGGGGSGSGIGVMSSSYAVRAAYSAAFSRYVFVVPPPFPPLRPFPLPSFHSALFTHCTADN